MQTNAIYSLNGIYAIRFDGYADTYVGATSRSFGKRTLIHLSELRGGYHRNKRLQELFNQLGEKALRVFVLDVGYKTKADLIRAEKKWGKELGKTFPLMNKVIGGRLSFSKKIEPFEYDGELPIFVGKSKRLRGKIDSLLQKTKPVQVNVDWDRL